MYRHSTSEDYVNWSSRFEIIFQGIVLHDECGTCPQTDGVESLHQER